MLTQERNLEDFIKIDKIGEGTYGVVYKGQDIKTGKLVAMKKIRLEAEDEGIPATALREISMLRELRHPNIVTLEDVIMQENRLYLIFEFLSMDLKKYLDNLDQNVFLEADVLKSFLYQICQGMCFCHQRRILHRDLKPQNLLVDAVTKTLKLADFGLARAIGVPVRPYTHEIVTLWYRAPEVLLSAPRYSAGVDIWSIGCIFAEMARKKPLFQGDSEIDQLFRIFKILSTPTEEKWKNLSHLPDFKSTFPKWTVNHLESKMLPFVGRDGLDLLEKTFIYEPVDRITAKQMLKHPYFDSLNKKSLPAGDYDGTLQLD